MQAAVVPEPHRLQVVETPDLVPGPGEVVVRVHAAGVCGTDVHLYHGGFVGVYPLIPGHEFAGQVCALGDGVTAAKVGDRVAVQPCLFCGQCDYCAENHGNFCRSMRAYGVHVAGGFAEQCVVRQENLVHLGDLSYAAGALLEPLACCLHGLKQIGLEAGERVVLFGAGPIGLLLAQLAVYGGAGDVTVVDPLEPKLELARELGVDHALTPAAFDAAREDRAPGGFHLAIDATGIAAVTQRLPELVRDRGRVLFFGVCPQDARVSVSPYDLYKRELTLAGTFSLFGEMGPALRLAQSGRINLERLISHRVPLAEFPAALERKAAGDQGLKVLVEPGA